MELRLIVSHNTANAIGVKVSGHLRKLEAHFGKLEQGPLKQVMIVGLEMDLPLLSQHLTVAKQEVGMGQPALGIPGTGPGIAEIDIDPVHFTGGKVLL